MASLTLNEVWKIYDGNVVAVQEANFQAQDGEFLALLGPSGCGKSSTMRMIAGLESVSRGEVMFDSQVVNNLSPAQRNVALAFESYALYSPLSVYDNLAFPLVSRGVERTTIAQKVKDIAKIFQIDDLLKRRPSALSGGQAQRVSLARALIRSPKVMLLDEPLSHLDYRLRTELRVRIRRIHDDLNATTIYVTHDQEEAVMLADRIIVMNHAEIQQIGTVRELWETPKNKFVASFLGDPAMNFVNISLEGQHAVCEAGRFSIKVPENTKSQQLTLGFRPEDTDVVEASGQKEGLFGEILVNEFHGEKCVLTVKTESGQFKVIVKGESSLRSGDQILLSPNLEKIHLFNRENDLAL